MPKTCQEVANCAALAFLAGRKISNLLVFNAVVGFDSVPGHHRFNRLQTRQTPSFVDSPYLSNGSSAKVPFEVIGLWCSCLV